MLVIPRVARNLALIWLLADRQVSILMNRADHWLTKFSHLRRDRARGDPAPHKPLLLLALCDLAEQGALPHSTLPLSPELAFRFYTY